MVSFFGQGYVTAPDEETYHVRCCGIRVLFRIRLPALGVPLARAPTGGRYWRSWQVLR